MTPAVAIALSGLHAATLKLNAAATNLANAEDAQRAQTSAATTARAAALKPGSGLLSMPEISPILEVANQAEAGLAFSAALKVFGIARKEEKTLLDLKT
jgi:flagellar basal body rod protein FlgC